MIKNIQNWWQKRTLYLQTYRELQSLTDRELRDLGLDRSAINTIAFESTYGAETETEAEVDVVEFNVRTKISNFFKFMKVPTQRDRINDWLSESTDAVDLERRLKMLDLQQAPWQLQAKTFSQGWAQ